MNLAKKDPPLERLNKARDQWKALGESAESLAAGIESDKPFMDEMLQIWAYSDFVSKACRRSPGMLLDLYQRQHLKQAYEADFYVQELTRSLAEVQSKRQKSWRALIQLTMMMTPMKSSVPMAPVVA